MSTGRLVEESHSEKEAVRDRESGKTDGRWESPSNLFIQDLLLPPAALGDAFSKEYILTDLAYYMVLKGDNSTCFYICVIFKPWLFDLRRKVIMLLHSKS